MKTFLAIFITLLMLTGPSCQDEFIPESFILNQEGSFRYGGIYYSGSLLKFKISEVNDSRCPSDVICIWQGEATIKIQLESPVKADIELSTYHHPTDTVGNYTFELTGVSPYPISTKEIEFKDYRISLLIGHLADD